MKQEGPPGQQPGLDKGVEMGTCVGRVDLELGAQFRVSRRCHGGRVGAGGGLGTWVGLGAMEPCTFLCMVPGRKDGLKKAAPDS